MREADVASRELLVSGQDGRGSEYTVSYLKKVLVFADAVAQVVMAVTFMQMYSSWCLITRPPVIGW
jgi:hypothetical protein